MSFSNTLICWYLQTNRALPWREIKDPYLVWLSEIILQQTRVSQGISYYLTFSDAFPTVKDLANADESKVLKMWQGLGYYSRARNLHLTAKYIAKELNGEFPTSYKELISLRGIGDYTASAIASICFNEPAAVLDGNVFRVLARYFQISTPVNTSRGVKEFKLLAQSLLDKEQPGVYNQAIMDFGALQCKPQNPDCGHCPINSSCMALCKKKVRDLPVKIKKIKVKKKYFNYIVFITKDNRTVFEQRVEKGIWKGLYQFPLVETPSEICLDELTACKDFQRLVPTHFKIHLFNKNTVVHKLSHQHLFTKFWIVQLESIERKTISWNKIELFPMPVLIANFLSDYKTKTGD